MSADGVWWCRFGFRIVERSGVARRNSTRVRRRRDCVTTSSVRLCRSSTPDCARDHPRAADTTTTHLPVPPHHGSVTSLVCWPPQPPTTSWRHRVSPTCSARRWPPACPLPDTTNTSGSATLRRHWRSAWWTAGWHSPTRTEPRELGVVLCFDEFMTEYSIATNVPLHLSSSHQPFDAHDRYKASCTRPG